MTKTEIEAVIEEMRAIAAAKLPVGFGVSIILSDGKVATYVGSNTDPPTLRRWVNEWCERVMRMGQPRSH